MRTPTLIRQIGLPTPVMCCLIVATLCIFGVGCGRDAVEEGQSEVKDKGPSEMLLIGSWRVDIPAPQSMVYTFHSNRTYEWGVEGGSGAVAGGWQLEGDRLVMVIGGVTNQFGSMGLPKSMYDTSTNRIATLNEGEMIWRNPGELRGLRLKRIKTR